MAQQNTMDIGTLATGSHVCCIHRTEAEHRDLVTKFMAAGLSLDQKVVYILDEHSRETVCDYLSEVGTSPEERIESGQLVFLHSAETYLKSGVFDPDKMIALLQDQTDQALAEGYSALRVTGEMTWATGGSEGCDRLIEYEAKLNHFFPGRECLAMCQYHRPRFSPDILLDVLSTHPIAFEGLEAFDNHYYVEPDVFLATSPAEARLNRAFEGLKREKHARSLAATQAEDLRGLLTNNADGILVVDAQGVLRFVNSAAERLLGRPGSALVGQPFGYPLSGEEEAEIELLRPGQAPILAEMRVDVTHWEGAIARVATLRDKTEQVRAEQRLRHITENMFDMVALLDEEGRFVYASESHRQLGFEPDQLIGRDILDQVQADERERIAAVLDALRESGGTIKVDLAGLTANGDTVWLESFAKVIQDESGALGMILSTRDVTARRQLESQLAQADRLSSMGMLAAGVAHEINNPLSYVLYNLESLNDDLPALLDAMRTYQARINGHFDADRVQEVVGAAGPKMNPAVLYDIQERFRDALGGTHRIRDIARGLGTFSRVERDQLVPVNLMYVIEAALNMCFNEIKYRARVVKDYGKIPTIMASEGRLSQVFLNLLVNAAHAIGDGDMESNEVRITTWADGDDVCAEVRDTGKGIAPEHVSKLFEPFFTTKEIGVGSGLGLPISKGIIEGYGGTLTVQSELDKGTAFLIRIPSRTEEIAPGTTEPEVEEQGHVSGRILIVDDEDGIRSAMVRMLRQHETVEASTGQAAREILEQDQAFDLILCDMMMPKVSGMDLHRWLAQVNPTLARRLIFITGGAFTPKARAYLRQVDNLRLEKPFDVANFKKIVAEMIRGAKEWRRSLRNANLRS